MHHHVRRGNGFGSRIGSHFLVEAKKVRHKQFPSTGGIRADAFISVVWQGSDFLLTMWALEGGQVPSALTPFFIDQPLQRFERLSLECGIFERLKYDLADGVVVPHAGHADMP